MNLPTRSNLRSRAIAGTAVAPTLRPDPELASQRDRLIERMTIMQSELGGLFYEMAIRDHVRMDVLIAKAAALQGVDIELAELEGRLKAEGGGVGAPQSSCAACGSPYLPGAAYCSQCAHPLAKG
jgi:hypothetical protein